jgi:hypothetical protein
MISMYPLRVLEYAGSLGDRLPADNERPANFAGRSLSAWRMPVHMSHGFTTCRPGMPPKSDVFLVRTARP